MGGLLLVALCCACRAAAAARRPRDADPPAGRAETRWQPDEQLREMAPRDIYETHDAAARVRWMLNRSMTQYARVKTPARAADVLARTLKDPYFIFVYRNRVYRSVRHDHAQKHKTHYLFSTLLSLARRSPLPNFAAAWDQGARGTGCSAKNPFTCLVIAKVSGYAAPGLLIPNPYFAHVGEWGQKLQESKAVADARPFESRDSRVFWRGAVAPQCNSGNVARVAAIALSLKDPKNFDVKCVQCTPPEALACAKQFPYTPDMVDATKAMVPNASGYALVHGGYVNTTNFSKWQYVLNLPGTRGGSYSRNLNYLWDLGSVVLLWDSLAVEWYYPGLQSGKTHLAVDAEMAANAVKAHGGATAIKELQKSARSVANKFLCGDCLERYWRELIGRVREHFQMASVLDDEDGADGKRGRPNAHLKEILKGVPCAELLEVRHIPNMTEFYWGDHFGHPCVYVPLDARDPLRAFCAPEGGHARRPKSPR
ncbi:hypothetical protein M885DRAFT_49290 [Pelagophyceae sp. CCMP2097]|nr:hypothetical protein M885DRAFT_49290 [Pelagophyceae sp. CCMP2097]